MTRSIVSRTLWTFVCVTGCTSGPDTPVAPDGDFEGIEEAGQALTDLSSECSFVSGTGVLTIALATGDVALVAKASSSAITINGLPCGGATSATLKKLVVNGTAGAQTLILDFMGGYFAPGISGATGIDVDLLAGADALKIRGGKTADAFVFGSTGITFNADAFKDISYAGVESFVVSMSDGDDSFSGAGSVATGGAAFATAVTVYGGAGNDTLRGGSGDDTLDGGAGNDTFAMGTAPDGADTCAGGAGTDIADYSARTAALTITIDGTGNDGEASEADDIGTDIETVKGGTANDTITGSTGPDTLYGGAGNDTLKGGDGNDILNGDAGNDTFDEEAAANGADVMNGGAGTDTVTYVSRTNAVSVSIDAAALDGETGELDKVMIDVENVVGGAGDDTIVGSASDNVLDGDAGNDTISGGIGNDTLKGGDGNDTLNGDAGDDTFDEGAATNGGDAFHGGAGVDTVSYLARTNDLTVVMDGITGSGEAAEGDVVSVDVENVVGGAGNDTLTGNAADNYLEGSGGTDTLFGLAGDDTLDGGAGADDLDCGAGDGDTRLDATVGSATGCEL